MRTAEITRKTAETDITLALCLDGTGMADVATGCGFLDHMLTLLASHGNFDLNVRCQGDTEVDFHHSVEDVGICLGQALARAIGEAKGITRYGSMLLPMDEALILCAVDISGREHLSFGLDIPAEKIGDFDTELAEEFFLAVVRHAKICVHLQQLAGKNSHHLIEGAFKAFARAMKQAIQIDAGQANKIPSSKGMLL